MSLVTNVVLLFDEYDRVPRMTEVDTFFPEGCGFGPTLWQLEDEEPNASAEGISFYGGTKRLESDVAVGAFNNLNLDSLKRHLSTAVRWENPDAVMLVYKTQSSPMWETWRLRGDPASPGAGRGPGS